MSQTLLRGLYLLEALDFHGPVGVSELSRLLGWDKATVSRTVAACEAEGWIERDAGQLSVGPRTSLLGRTNSIGLAQRDADLLVHAISGVTGVIVQAYALVGGECVVLASAGPPDAGGHDPARHLMSVRMPLWATAAGKVIAAQLSGAQRDVKLPPDTVPDSREILASGGRAASAGVLAFYRSTQSEDVVDDPADTTRVATRAALEDQLAAISRDGLFVERREMWARSACVAAPWARVGAVCALACLTTIDVVDRDRPLLERVLRAAVRPGANRESIVAAAATPLP